MLSDREYIKIDIICKELLSSKENKIHNLELTEKMISVLLYRFYANIYDNRDGELNRVLREESKKILETLKNEIEYHLTKEDRKIQVS